MASSKRVAVILVNYESGNDLVSALWSLVQSERSPDVFIVVDNASRDDSLYLAQKDFPQLIIINNLENVGFAKAVNQGLRKAKEYDVAYVWLFNPDARARKDTLSKLLCAAVRMPRTIFSPIIFDDQGRIWFSGGKLSWWRMRAQHRRTVCSQTEKTEDFLTGCALFLSLMIVDTVGEFDEEYFLYYEDADFCLRARNAGFQLCVVPGSIVDHGEVSRNHPQKLYYLVYSGLLFFFKHTCGVKAGYMEMYVTIRRLKNWLDCLLFGGKEAALVRQAYVDFFRKKR